MPEERRLNAQARERLARIQAGYERFARRTRILLAILTVAQIGLGLLSIHLLTQNGERAAENRALIHQIQDERRYAVRFQCHDVNQRAAATDRELLKLVPRGRQRRLKPTRILLARVLPVRDCEHLVDQFVGAP